MRRGKVQLRKIEEKSNRQVTFSKRRSGLMKKARELAVLCGVDVSLLIFSETGRPYKYCSTGSLKEILEHCPIYRDAAEIPGSNIDSNKVDAGGHRDQSTCVELLPMIQRYLEGQQIQQLNVTEVTQLEHQLDALLGRIRIRKTQVVMEAPTEIHEKEEQQLRVQLIENEFAATINETTEDYLQRGGGSVPSISLQNPRML